MTIHEKHMQLIDAVNNATTDDEHWSATRYLDGWRDGIQDTGHRLSLIDADLTQFRRGFEHRPMCAGVFLDWKEAPAQPLPTGGANE